MNEEEKAEIAASIKGMQDDSARPKQSDILIQIAKRGALFHNHEDVAFADIECNGHRETWPVRSVGYRKWLLHCYYKENDSAPNNEAAASALNVIEAEATFRGDEHPVAVRIGGYDGKIYLDLCNKDWQAIEIDADGWRVVHKPPVRFIRSRGMLPLPIPTKKKKTKDGIRTLKQFINVKDDADFSLVVAWVLGAFRDRGPYPVLAFIAQHGSAKSTSLKVLRALIDPNAADLRAPPKTADDLYITAARSHVVPLDNVSSLPEWLSDALCRISTGMSYAKRMLFTDQDEVLIYAVRPIAITSIVEMITAPDLGDRTIKIVPPRIDEENRREEATVLAAFEKERPVILAAFLDVVAHGLKTLPSITDTKWPRMADFAKWVTACEGAYDTKGTFRNAYSENRSNAISALLGEDPVASAVMQLALTWQGQIGKLLGPLAQIAGDQIKSKEWPKSARGLGSALRRLMPFLRENGIMVEPPPEKDKTRTWVIQAVAPRPPEQPDQQPSQQRDDKRLKAQAESQTSGGLGVLGCSFPNSTGNGLGRKANEADSQPVTVGKQPPEQPDAAFSRNGFNGLNSGGRSGHRSGDDNQTPEQPDDDLTVLPNGGNGAGGIRCDTGAAPGGDDLTIPQYLDRRSEVCAQCGAGRPDDPPTVAVRAKNGSTVYVHERGCLRFWKKDHGDAPAHGNGLGDMGANS